MPEIDRELRELLVSVSVLLVGFWIALKLTSGLVWDWNGWSVIEPQSYPICEENRFLQFTCSTAWIGMIETIKIAILATFFGMILSLPMGLLSSRNLFPQYVTYPSRTIVSACRSLPSIIWAIIFVILVGLGPIAGIMAMTIYTVGYLGKMQYEAIEGMNNAPLEAANAMGLTKAEISLGVIIPETANHLIAQAIFMFEYNVRSGTVIGIVGAGGIGYYINLYLKFLQYDEVGAYLLIIFLVVMLIDLMSIYLRSFFTDDSDNTKPTWSGVLLPSRINVEKPLE
ncbi:MAG TPA: phosphonate ABC transporter, permease protein PhnE [Candidatus Thalassarchaeaceae archaeon]|nr:phosphonate ABC transporter, permease protein PhnE [Candidatus Thalassarchaeaceae archaeon]